MHILLTCSMYVCTVCEKVLHVKSVLFNHVGTGSDGTTQVEGTVPRATMCVHYSTVQAVPETTHVSSTVQAVPGATMCPVLYRQCQELPHALSIVVCPEHIHLFCFFVDCPPLWSTWFGEDHISSHHSQACWIQCNRIECKVRRVCVNVVWECPVVYQVSLSICLTDLSSCTTRLLSCSTDVSSCTTRLLSCLTDLSSCTTRLLSCLTDLSSCTTRLLSCLTDVCSCTTRLLSCLTDLSSCTTRLLSCLTDLSSCTTRLLSCLTDVSGCTTRLLSCLTDLSSCTTRLLSCLTDVSGCITGSMSFIQKRTTIVYNHQIFTCTVNICCRMCCMRCMSVMIVLCMQ